MNKPQFRRNEELPLAPHTCATYRCRTIQRSMSGLLCERKIEMKRALSAFSVAALAACLAVGAGAGPASAATDDPGANGSSAAAVGPSPNFTVSADGWIQYQSLLTRVGAPAKVTLLKGQRNAAGACTSSGGSDSGPTTSTAVAYTEEVAFNPQTCESKVATSTLSPAQANQLQALSLRLNLDPALLD